LGLLVALLVLLLALPLPFVGAGEALGDADGAPWQKEEVKQSS